MVETNTINHLRPDTSYCRRNDVSPESSRCLGLNSDESSSAKMDEVSFMSNLSMETSLNDLFPGSTTNPWIWVIEYVAKFKTDIAALHDAFEMASDVPDDLGRNANEMVAFRCLAYLFDADDCQIIDSSADTGLKINFDLSESSEDVLQRILEETPLEELKPCAPGLSKWNARPFVLHKRNQLHECTLEKIKTAIIRGRDLFFSSLRKSSGLSRTSEQYGNSVDYNQFDARPVSPASQHIPREDNSDRNGISKDKVETGRPNEGAFGDSLENRKEKNVTAVLERSKDESSKRSVCIKCRQDGRMLICVGMGCSVLVHVNCLPSPPKYDSAGGFLCPKCVYARANAEYVEYRNQVAVSRGKITKFLKLRNSRSRKTQLEI